MFFGALYLWGGLAAVPMNTLDCFQEPGEDYWLEEGSSLDLRTGETLDGELSAGRLVLSDGVLLASPELVPLGGADAGQPLRVIRREPAGLRSKTGVGVGAEYLFVLEDDSWGYLRVLGSWPAGVSLEVVLAPKGVTELIREPRWLEARLDQSEYQLIWDSTEGRRYRIEGRAAGPDQTFANLGEIEGGSWSGPALGSEVMEYRVTALGGSGLGVRRRVVRQTRSEDLPAILPKGARWNLLTGEVNGALYHLEVTQNQGQNLIFALAEGMRAGPAAKSSIKRSGARPSDLGSWRPSIPWQRDAEQPMRQHVLPAGATLCLITPEGVPVRIRSEIARDGGLLHWRQLDLCGSGLFPSAPGEPRAVFAQGRVEVSFEPLTRAAPDPGRVRLVLEEADEDGEWVRLAVGAVGERSIGLDSKVSVDALPIVRFRVRQEYEGGPHSPASEPFNVLLVDRDDAATLKDLAERGVLALREEAYGRRMQARALLLALGPEALPALEAALTDPASGTETRSSVRDLLLSGGFGPGGQRLVLLAMAREEGLEGDVPRGLDASEALYRALAVLELAGRPSASDWLRLAAHAEPDPAVTALINLVLEDPEPPQVLDQPGDLLVLLPPARRPLRESRDWVQELRSGAPEELAALIRGTVDASQRDRAMALLAVAHYLEAAENPPEARTLESAEIALRMLDRVRPALSAESEASGLPARALLDLIDALLDGEGHLLRSQRELASLQLDSWPLPDGAREQIVVPADDEGALREILLELSREKEVYVDILIPAGRHVLSEALSSQRLGVSGMRLKGEEGTVLVGTLRLEHSRDVVLENLTIEGNRTSALWITETELFARDVTLSGIQRAVQAQGASLVLDRCRIGNLDSSSNAQLIWLAQGSVLEARNSAFLGGNIYLDEGGEAHFDRCVLDAGARPTVQGRSATSRASLRDCLVRGRAGCMSGAGTIWLERCVLDLAADPIYQAVTCVACPDSVVLVGAASGFGPHVQQRCCLGR
ncbi:MAG TPA: hypothetical protein EYQ25_00875 [Planctomycetes bacterium]|nr:hypothetical protein [Planctomycetota bacterium]HIL37861.1 hypothetical protein [Planctomycetota bacterium]